MYRAAKRAADRTSAVEWAAEKMLALARSGDRAGVERVYAWARAQASGSNARKWALDDARNEALRVLAGEEAVR
jgi:hypothetical protein